jgi:hypothetical protein
MLSSRNDTALRRSFGLVGALAPSCKGAPDRSESALVARSGLLVVVPEWDGAS